MQQSKTHADGIQLLQSTQRNVQIPYSPSNDNWTVLALNLAALLAPVTNALYEETKSLQFCANLSVRGAFTADHGYTQQVHADVIIQLLAADTLFYDGTA